jgi:hypothetical protein
MTIIPEDNVMTIEGQYKEVDLSSMDSSIHAVQWYNTWGEIEHKDPITRRMTHNEEFTDISRFQSQIDAWNIAPLPPSVVDEPPSSSEPELSDTETSSNAASTV